MLGLSYSLYADLFRQNLKDIIEGLEYQKQVAKRYWQCL